MGAIEPMAGESSERFVPQQDSVAEQPFFPDLHLVAVALEAGKVGVWSWDIAARQMTWSTNLELIHQLPEGTLDASSLIFESDIHAQDRAGVMAAIEETLRTEKAHRTLYRLATGPEREERWIEALAAVVRKGGDPVRLVGTCRDVTERVRLHRELRMRARQQEALARLGERG